MSGVDRKQILRIDCRACKGNGYIKSATGETDCLACGGSGVEEKEVDYKFETQGRWSDEEKAEAFGIKVEEAKDDGHSEAKAPAGEPTE